MLSVTDLARRGAACDAPGVQRRLAALPLLLVCGLASVLAGCAWQDTKDFATGRSISFERTIHDKDDAEIQLSASRLRETSEGGELSIRLRNVGNARRFVRLGVDEQDGPGGCEHVYGIDPESERRFTCQLASGVPRVFVGELTTFADLGETDVVERGHFELHFDDRGVGAIHFQ